MNSPQFRKLVLGNDLTKEVLPCSLKLSFEMLKLECRENPFVPTNQPSLRLSMRVVAVFGGGGIFKVGA